MVKKKKTRTNLGDGRKQKALENIYDKLTKEERELLELRKNYENRYLKEPDAARCGARTDQLYQQWDATMSNIDSTVYNVLSAKSKIDRNKQEVLKGIQKMYPGTTDKMTEEEIEIEIIHGNKIVADGLRQLWLLLANLYRFVEVKRIDQKKFFSEKSYKEKVVWVKTSLEKRGIDLYQQRT